MTKEELALQLNGRQYGDEISEEQERLAKENNLIVIFGASDDLVEFRGALLDEIGAYEGCDFMITKPGTEVGTGEYYNNLPTYFKADELMAVEINEDYPSDGHIPERISALWCPKDQDVECAWYIKTELPHASFNIMEDGDIECRGIVLNVSDL